MAGPGPTVTATIQAKDLATPVIDSVRAHARAAGVATAQFSSGVAGQFRDSSRLMATHMGTAADTIAAKFRSAGAEASLAFGGFALKAARDAMHVGEAVSDVERRIRSFTSATPAMSESYRKLADTTGSAVKGGPEAFLEAVRVAATSGVSPAAAASAAKVGAIYATEAGETIGQGTEHLLLHSLVGGDITNEAGKVIPVSQATAEQITRGMVRASDLLQAQNRLSPGSLPSIYEMAKVAFPVTRSFGVSNEQTFAVAQELAEHGLEGSHAGEIIRSLYSSLASPTAKARSAIRTAGLDYGQYVHLNTGAADAGAIEKGIELRAGALNDATKALIAKTVEHFKLSGDLDAAQTDLTDALLKSGSKSMKNRTTAGNLARDTLAQFVDGVDLRKFLADVATKGLGVGFANKIFGRDMGGPSTLISGANVQGRVERIEAEEAKHPTDIAEREMRDSYTGAKQRMTGAYQGMMDQLFLSQEGNLKHLYNASADVMSTIAGAPKAVQAWGAEMGAAFAVTKTSGFLSSVTSFGSEMAKLAPGAEGAAASLGRLSGVLGLMGRFSPLGEAITAYDLTKNVAMPILSTLGTVAKGTYWTPVEDDDYRGLAGQRDELKRQLADHERNAFRPGDSDPTLMGLNHQLGAARARDDGANDAPFIASLREEWNSLRHSDPNASDPKLKRLYAQSEDLNERFKQFKGTDVTPLGGMTTELVNLRHAIEDRESTNVQAQAARLKVVEDKLTSALSRQPAGADESPQVTALRKQIGDRETDLRAGYVAPFDPVRQQIQDQLADVENRLGAYVSKITGSIKPGAFLTDGISNGRVDLGFGHLVPPGSLSIAPGIDPRPNQGISTLRVETVDINTRHASSPFDIGSGPHFGLKGPLVEPLHTEPLRKGDMIAPETKVSVAGTMTGQAELHNNVSIEIKPSEYFAGVMKSTQSMAHLLLSGSYGPTMRAGGDNGIEPSKPTIWHGPH